MGRCCSIIKELLRTCPDAHGLDETIASTYHQGILPILPGPIKGVSG
jgi:hypothetical protein